MLCKRGLRLRPVSESIQYISQTSSWTCALCSSYAGASLAHGKRRPRLSNATHNTRPYSSATRLPRAALGTVTTSVPSQTTIDQLLEPLQTSRSYPADNVPSSSTNARLSILVTPSFAQHALDHRLPLKAYELLRVNKDGLRLVETVTAVVDRLPAVKDVSQKPPLVREEQLEGSEGLAYFFTLEDKIEVESEDDPTLPQEPVIGFRGKPTTPFQGKPGTLTFSMPGTASPLIPDHTLELPLAHTIFSTQRVSTLIHTIYAVNDQQQFLAQRQHEPRSLNIALPTRSNGNNRSVQLPLLPLTPARQVKYSMGNILRQLWHTADSTSGGTAGEATPQPASQELEKAVSSYFETVGLDAQAVAVWAVIVPKATPVSGDNSAARHLLKMRSDEIKKSWSEGDGIKAHPEVQNLINHGILGLIYQGAKLCKVLSGGGGWGKKAGLLSLDPDNSYAITEQGNIQTNPARVPGADLQPLDEDTPSAFGQIAEAGDQVMFFLAPTGLDGSRIKSHLTSSRKSVKDKNAAKLTPAFVFGALPSSIDSVPMATANSTEVKITHTPSVFGMLSEGGMALTLSSPNNAHSSREVVRTKIDVPFARLNGTKGDRVVKRNLVDKFLQEEVQTPESKDQITANRSKEIKLRRHYSKPKARLDAEGEKSYRFVASLTTIEGTNVAKSPTTAPNQKSISTTHKLHKPVSIRHIPQKRIKPRGVFFNFDYVDAPKRYQARQTYDLELQARHRAPQMAGVFDLMTQSDLYAPAAPRRASVDEEKDDLGTELFEDVQRLVHGRGVDKEVVEAEEEEVVEYSGHHAPRLKPSKL